MAGPESDDDRRGLAAEYVLGTLEAAERAEVERRLASDPELAAEVARWQSRLEPLLAAVPPESPSAGTFDKVLARIGSAPEDSAGARVVRLERQVGRWRGAAIAAGALAAGLLVFVSLRELARPPAAPEEFVAVLETQDRNPAFVATVNVAAGTVTLRRLAGTGPEAGHSYELWAVGGGREAPQSLGVVGRRASLPVARLGATSAERLGETVFAISIEPEGGSPTGQPTGPVTFTGRLVPIARE